MSCRCGWTEGPHLCHACAERPGQRYFYVPTWRFALAGAQMKVSATDTIACDPCWEKFVTFREVVMPIVDLLRSSCR